MCCASTTLHGSSTALAIRLGKLEDGSGQADSSCTASCAAQVRYRDGRLVSTRGEKYIVESVSEEYDGGSRGKVKTKGAGGLHCFLTGIVVSVSVVCSTESAQVIVSAHRQMDAGCDTTATEMSSSLGVYMQASEV